jgi:subtilisin family serine protease
MASRADGPIREPGGRIGTSLVKSVISQPLLERIEGELATTDDLVRRFPELARKYKTFVFLNPKYPGGLDAARETVRGALKKFYRSTSTRAAARLDGTVAEHMLLGSLKPQAVDYLLGLNEPASSPIQQIWPSRWDVIIDINLEFRERRNYQGDGPAQIATRKPHGNPYNADPRRAAKRVIIRNIEEAKRRVGVVDDCQRVDMEKTELSNQYVFARIEGRVLLELVRIDRDEGHEFTDMAERDQQTKLEDERVRGRTARQMADAMTRPQTREHRVIHRIWPDFDLHHCTHRSLRTVKADAAQNSFSAFGEGITWAVVDSGIDWRHPHFVMHKNIDPDSPFHRDFTGAAALSPLTDEKGHGTHVAGIIAGQQVREKALPVPPAAPYDAAWRLQGVERVRDVSNDDDDTYVAAATTALSAIGGIAPKCKLVSLKVLDQFGHGKASNVIAAIAHIQLVNGHGRDLKIHGVNLSLGHSFDPKWFACGHSPLCVEVNRLVKSGVVVVVAAGNTGYGVLKSVEGDRNSGLDLSINDPGNAELAITVGATHRESPHRFGVSYFSSKGPTGDGRYKPDLLAPGERIVSAAAAGSKMAQEFGGDVEFAYFESSGTSMAAPHVSGAIAAFLSIRSEFVGEPEKVKQIFTSTATDLGRDRYFQGAGLVDLLRAIQSV